MQYELPYTVQVNTTWFKSLNITMPAEYTAVVPGAAILLHGIADTNGDGLVTSPDALMILGGTQ
ncbi:MAG: hypothetical protein LAKADJCE_00140 [Candidatus Argoarchaeum ethanivorans]|uniref:Uncharacterized protein n=1 Tax=Candidatus Argoarchaeum ethanivorans TaxID=2608793 RepID=A0A811T2V4_9EURY|nr:MAG: hypothetical protein LAKADJCE_00140 [Candidatus Argoarchaeum ethanivorans]